MPLFRHRPFRRLLGFRALRGTRRVIDDELAFHLEQTVAELTQEGRTLAEARAEAERRFGSVETVRDDCRTIAHRRARHDRIREAFDEIGQNLVYGLRQLRANPGVSTAAVLSLVVGVGAATTLFSVAQGTLFKPLPFLEPERLVRLWSTNPELSDMQASIPDFLDWQVRSTQLQTPAAIGFLSLALTDRTPALRLNIAPVSASFFPVLGVEPAIGRTFSEAEDLHGGPTDVAVLSHRLFVSRFAGNAEVVGQRLDLDGRGFTVVGVMPSDFSFPEWADLWVPLAPDPARERDDHELDVIARLEDGVGMAQAQAEMDGIAADLARNHPVSNDQLGVRITGFDDWLIGPAYARAVHILLGAVTLLVLLACANVANLLLARGLARRREISLRCALGAGRRRLVRQLLTEGALLAVIGGIGGVAVAWLAVLGLRALEPTWIPRLDDVRIDGSVLGFALLAVTATGCLFAVAPALQTTAGKLVPSLGDGGRVSSSSGTRLRGVLVGVEIGLATLLLIGAGLLLDTVARLQRVDTGFDPGQIAITRLQLPTHRYGWEQRGELAARLDAALRNLPGVEASGFSNVAPFGAFRPTNTLRVVGREDERFFSSDWRSISPSYFHTLGIPLLQGRAFATTDDGSHEPVTIINETMAQALWPDGDALDGLIDWGSPGGRPLRVVGVVGDVRDVDLTKDRWTLYRPHRQLSWAALDLLVKSALPLETIAPAIRQAVMTIDPNLAMPPIRLLEHRLSSAAARQRSTMMILVAFAVLALMLSASGIYGLTAFAVSRRQREMGIRLALGARPHGLIRALLVSGLRLASLGGLVGATAAAALTNLLGTLLYETAPIDARIYTLVLMILLGVTALASYLPARRTMRLDPAHTLRAD